MAVRPFYIEANIEGRQTRLSGGPKSSKGGTEVYIHQREQGVITTPYKIIQRSLKDGDLLELVTEVYFKGDLIHTHTTNY